MNKLNKMGMVVGICVGICILFMGLLIIMSMIKEGRGDRENNGKATRFSIKAAKWIARAGAMTLPKTRLILYKVPDGWKAPAEYRQPREHITESRDQEGCAACWSFSIADVSRDKILRKGENVGPLSVQYFVSCTSKHWGCGIGGAPEDLYTSSKFEKGIPTEKDYPYLIRDSMCRRVKEGAERVAIVPGSGRMLCIDINGLDLESKNVVMLENIKRMKHAIVEKGSIVGTINARKSLYEWKPDAENRGVYTPWKYIEGYKEEDDPSFGGHAISIVGFDHENWVCRNSWGKSWGNAGFFKVKIGEDYGGIESRASTFDVVLKRKQNT
jgi:hypothetical protein